MALPGAGKSFDEFKVDDVVCRQWAAEQTGVSTNRAANDAAVSGAAAGTVLGAASGHPATGAAVGAGVGLLSGTAVGASNAKSTSYAVQHRYDMGYLQYVRSGQSDPDASRGSMPRYRHSPEPPDYRARPLPNDIPPPPPGPPPSPPAEW